MAERIPKWTAQKSGAMATVTLPSGPKTDLLIKVRLPPTTAEHLDLKQLPQQILRAVEEVSVVPKLWEILNFQASHFPELGPHTQNALANAGIPYVGQWALEEEKRFIDKKNINRKRRDQVRTILLRFGLRFGMTRDELFGWQPPSTSSSHT